MILYIHDKTTNYYIYYPTNLSKLKKKNIEEAIFDIDYLEEEGNIIFDDIYTKDDVTTVEWDDHHANCSKNLNEENCNKSENCLWIDRLGEEGKCVKQTSYNNDNVKNACESYNFEESKNDPYVKKKLCIKTGCNIISLSSDKKGKEICVDPRFLNHDQYCQDAHSDKSCSNKNSCKWDNKLNKCIPEYKTTNDICQQITNDSTINKRCLNSKTKNNNDYCYINSERDFYHNIIPYTGLKEFKKDKCLKLGCKFYSTLKNYKGMCVDPDFSDEKDICFNYYNKLNFHNNQAYKCSKIGCKFSKKLKRIDSSGMVLDGSCVYPDFIKDNKLDFYK